VGGGRRVSTRTPRPSRADLQAAIHRVVDDVVAPGLRVLFCGINPGLYTAATGHHFARPGNRFWGALHAGGFTPRLFDPSEERQLLPLGYGITNLAPRTTASAAELARAEIMEGGRALREKVLVYRPGLLAILGVGAYRMAFSAPRAALGEQEQRIGRTRIWVLPNPSGLNAHYQANDLARLFTQLRLAAERLEHQESP
jgi:double-stranded uracil-DNA glycosylase